MDVNKIIDDWTYDLNADSDEFGNMYKGQFVITGYDIEKLKSTLKDALMEDSE